MYSQNPIVGTYRAGVRVGNWFEDIALEEVGELAELLSQFYGRSSKYPGRTKV